MKKLLALSWFSVLIALVALQSQFEGASTVFFGITDDSAQTISFEYPVDILDLTVIDGQKVDQGNVLLKVRRSSLVAKQAVLNERINELNSRETTSIAAIKSEIKSLLAKKAADQASLDVKIHKLLAQYRTNQKLLADITGSTVSANTARNPFQGQINELKKQRSFLGRSVQAQIDNLKDQLKNKDRPIHAKMNELRQKQTELDRQTTELVVRAQLAGRVGNVLYKSGETIDAFMPILSIHALSPERVKGYINENVYNQVMPGQKVWISSLALSSAAKGEAAAHIGIVENIGNRIVEYPPRLKKNVLVPAFGREVQIKLLDSDTLLLGEKVHIGLQPPKPSISNRAITYVTAFFNTYAKGYVYVADK